MNSARLMAKAQRALEAATRAAQAGDTETAADRVYYSVYYSDPLQIMEFLKFY